MDSAYVDRVVDFLRAYADRCHHGKEEDILFHHLAGRDLEPSLKETMDRLVADHQWARATTRLLVAANASAGADASVPADSTAPADTPDSADSSLPVGYPPLSVQQGPRGEVRRLLGELAAFYPEHIRLEDEAFFRPVMTYLSKEEQTAMLEAFTKFDASLIHEKYRRMAQDLAAE